MSLSDDADRAISQQRAVQAEREQRNVLTRPEWAPELLTALQRSGVPAVPLYRFSGTPRTPFFTRHAIQEVRSTRHSGWTFWRESDPEYGGGPPIAAFTTTGDLFTDVQHRSERGWSSLHRGRPLYYRGFSEGSGTVIVGLSGLPAFRAVEMRKVAVEVMVLLRGDRSSIRGADITIKR